MTARRVLVITHESIGQRMAGQAIRYWELARVLARRFRVILAAPGASAAEDRLPDVPQALAEQAAGSESVPTPGLSLSTFTRGDPSGHAHLRGLATGWAEAVVCSGDSLPALPFLHSLPVPLAADVYIPSALESLAWHASSPPQHRLSAYEYSRRLSRLVASHADRLFCANERQRFYWLGVLSGAGRLHPDLYASDGGLRNLVDVVPFGCPAEGPPASQALKGMWPGIGATDPVILWGSGIWNWFDPLTLLHAMREVLTRHPRARLVFLGTAHPDSELVPEMATAREARRLSQELALDGTHVFWVDWVPYAERGAYWLDADVAVSLHKPGVEAQIAFRTRLLDGVWSGTPMVVTQGDVLSEELEALGAGIAVPPGDAQAVARAVAAILSEPDARASRAAAFAALRHKYAWEAVAEPLARFCESPTRDRCRLDLLSGSAAAGGTDGEGQALKAEIARLRALVRGYESGRVMRALAWLHRVRRVSRR